MSRVLTHTRAQMFIAAAVTLGLVSLASAAFELTAPAAAGAEFTVNSTADDGDASPGDGMCATSSGECTLRAAIEETNALDGPNTVTVPAGTYYTGDLEITDDLTLTGEGAEQTIIDGGGVRRVFTVLSPPQPKTPTPTPTPAPSPTPTPVPQRPIDFVAADMDIAGNTPNSIGTMETCGAVPVGGHLTIDVVVAGIPNEEAGTGGIAAFAFDLIYDSSHVRVISTDVQQLLGVMPGSLVFNASDTVPDGDGTFASAAVDLSLGTVPLEAGSGVLARITLEGLTAGTSELTLMNVGIMDAAGDLYEINGVQNAQFIVGGSCPGDSSAEMSLTGTSASRFASNAANGVSPNVEISGITLRNGAVGSCDGSAGGLEAQSGIRGFSP